MKDLIEAARAALTELDAVLCDPEGHSSIRGSVADNAIIDSALALLRAALAAAEAQPAQEPVAHMYPSDLEKFQRAETFATAYSIAVGCPEERTVPLYTAPPQAPAAPAQAPLTDEQIKRLASEDVGLVTGENQRIGDDYAYRSIGRPSNVLGEHLIEFARAIERAHGIGAAAAPDAHNVRAKRGPTA